VLKGIRRHQGFKSDKRMPMTVRRLRPLLRKIKNRKKNRDIAAARSAWLIGLFGLLRTAEFLSESKKIDIIHTLLVRDVQWVPCKERPKYIKIHIRASKTDIWREGVWIVIGCSGDPELRPVLELQETLRDRFGGWLWKPSEPLFLVDGGPFTKKQSSDMLKVLKTVIK